MAAGNMLDIYISFGFLLVYGKASYKKGIYSVCWRGCYIGGNLFSNAAKQSRIWRADIDRLMYADFCRIR